MLDIDVVKGHLGTQAVDAWLIYSFRDSNPLLPYVTLLHGSAVGTHGTLSSSEVT
jgi:hypothetical protein